MMLSDYHERAGGALPRAIRKIRFGLSLTGAEFGRLIGANGAEISTYESGRKKPRAARLIRLIRLAPEELRAPLVAELNRQGLSLSDIGTPLRHDTSIPQPAEASNV